MSQRSLWPDSEELAAAAEDWFSESRLPPQELTRWAASWPDTSWEIVVRSFRAGLQGTTTYKYECTKTLPVGDLPSVTTILKAIEILKEREHAQAV
jgi:hypothetical protein